MEQENILERMRRTCSMREYCCSDIRKKIERLDAGNIDADKIIATLCREKFIDETRYATAFARDKSALQGWGPVKIAYALRGKGIEKETIDEAVGALDSEKSAEKLQSLLKNKYKGLKGEENEKKLKLFRFATSRGFSYNEILKAYDNIRTT